MLDRGVVVVIDLCDIGPADPIDVDGAQRSAIRNRRGAVNSGRLLILDRVDKIGQRGEQMRALLSEYAVHSVLVLLSGDEEGEGILCSLPESLIRPGNSRGVIWVGDRRGIAWDGVHRREGAPVSNVSDPDGNGNWDALFDAICLPEVYDSCVDALGSMAPPVGSPGLRLIRAGGRGLEPGLHTLALRVVHNLAEGEPHLESLAADDELDPLLGKALSAADPFDDRAGLGYALRLCEVARKDATETLGRLKIGAFTTRGAGDALRSVVQVAEALDALDRSWRSTIGRIDSSDGINRKDLAVLDQAKLVLTDRSGNWLRVASSRLRSLVLEALDRTKSFEAAAYLAAQVAKGATPQDQLTVTARIQQLGLSDSAVALKETRPPWERLERRAVFALALVAMATSAVAPHVLTLLLAPTLSVGILIVSRACYAAWFPDARLSPSAVAEFAGLLAALVAAAWIGSFSSLDVNDSVLVVALVASGALAWRLIAAQRKRQFLEWRESVALQDIGLQLDRFRQLVPAIALNEIVLANMRRSLAELAESVSGLMRSMAEVCLDARMPPPSSGAGPSSLLHGDLINIGGVMNEHLGELSLAVGWDALRVAQATLDATWAAVVAGASVDELGVEEQFSAALAEYLEHLFRSGPLVPPPWDTTTSEPRVELIRKVWTRALSDESLMGIGDSTSLLQLCRSSQLVYVATAVAAPLIRFVSREVPPEVAPTAVRTEAGDLGGAIRLVPVVPGAIRVIA